MTATIIIFAIISLGFILFKESSKSKLNKDEININNENKDKKNKVSNDPSKIKYAVNRPYHK